MGISYWRKRSGKLSSAGVCALESVKYHFYIMFFAVLSSVVNPRHICWFIEYNYQFLSFEICKLANPLIITKLVIQLVKIRSRWAKMRDSFLVIIKGVIFAFFLFIYNPFWISKKTWPHTHCKFLGMISAYLCGIHTRKSNLRDNNIGENVCALRLEHTH